MTWHRTGPEDGAGRLRDVAVPSLRRDRVSINTEAAASTSAALHRQISEVVTKAERRERGGVFPACLLFLCRVDGVVLGVSLGRSAGESRPRPPRSPRGATCPPAAKESRSCAQQGRLVIRAKCRQIRGGLSREAKETAVVPRRRAALHAAPSATASQNCERTPDDPVHCFVRRARAISTLSAVKTDLRQLNFEPARRRRERCPCQRRAAAERAARHRRAPRVSTRTNYRRPKFMRLKRPSVHVARAIDRALSGEMVKTLRPAARGDGDGAPRHVKHAHKAKKTDALVLPQTLRRREATHRRRDAPRQARPQGQEARRDVVLAFQRGGREEPGAGAFHPPPALAPAAAAGRNRRRAKHAHGAQEIQKPHANAQGVELSRPKDARRPRRQTQTPSAGRSTAKNAN